MSSHPEVAHGAATAARKIPATVLTGFLGSGKTTMIRHLLERCGDRRLALIINEFGDLGVDRDLVRDCGTCDAEDIVELANGCICCTVADDFLPAMQALIGRPEPPDHIVIETSGLALPKPLLRAFNWPEVKTRATVDGVIAVIDTPAVAGGRFADDPGAVDRQRRNDPGLDHDNPLEEVFADQIMSADMIVLNKADLVDGRAAADARLVVERHARPGTRVIMATRGSVDPLALLGVSAAAEGDLESRRSHHDGDGDDHDHEDFESFTVILGAVDAPEALERRLVALAERHDILRIKGFVHVAGKPMRHVVQGVGTRIERYFDRPWQAGEERRSHLVLIGLKGLDRTRIAGELGGRLP